MKLLLTGSITNSEAKYPDGIKKRFGGGIMYGGRAAASLGIDTTLITIGAEDIEPGIEELRSLGMTVKRVSRPTSNNFSNDYSGPERKLCVRSFTDKPLHQDEVGLEKEFDAVILFPLLSEISPSVCELFKNKPIMLDPQGFTRQLGEKTPEGLYPIIQSHWEDIEKWAGKIDILKMSNDDLSGVRLEGAQSEEEKAKVLGEKFGLAVITRGTDSTIVAQRGLPLSFVDVYKAENPSGLSPAGAGEVFAVGFMFEFVKTKDALSAAKFANACASLSVSGQKVTEESAKNLV